MYGPIVMPFLVIFYIGVTEIRNSRVLKNSKHTHKVGQKSWLAGITIALLGEHVNAFSIAHTTIEMIAFLNTLFQSAYYQ